jgi:hypothetical protein
MKSTSKRIIFISLIILLLIGAILYGPRALFAFDLYTSRYDAAESVYLSQFFGTGSQRDKADEMIGAYMDRLVNRYYREDLTYESAMASFTDLSNHQVFRADALIYMGLIEEMEAARVALAQANSCYDKMEYAQAIPLFRKALIADDTAQHRLAETEAEYKAQVLDQATADIDAGRYTAAESILQQSQTVLGSDDPDLNAALEDTRNLAKEAAFLESFAKARKTLREEGPAAAIQYMRELREQHPSEYGWEFMEQQILHEYEDDICSQAKALQDAGDLSGACSVLEDGLKWIDSSKMLLLLAEIRGNMLFLLEDMPVLMDETGSARTGADSTVKWDRYLTDARSNSYSHSLSADLGSITFDLTAHYAVFAGTVAFPQGEKADLYRSSADLMIYGDDKLLCEFKKIDSSTAPIPFSVQVTGVRELTLRWISEGANGWKDWGWFATVFDGRFVTKNPADTEQD